MKKVLFYIYFLVVIFCVLYGFPMAIANIGRDNVLVIAHFIVGAIGLLMLGAFAMYNIKKKKKDIQNS